MRHLKAVLVVLISAVAVAQEADAPDAGQSHRASRRSDDRGSSDSGGRRSGDSNDSSSSPRRRSSDSGGSGYSYSGEVASVLSGKTLGAGSIVHAQFGWPGISASLLASASRNIDIGARLSLLYAPEGITVLAGNPGLKLQGLLRLELLERGRINLGLEFSPGFFFYSASYYYPGATLVGLTFPVGLALGFAVSPNLMLSLGLDMPFFLAFGYDVAVPVRVGAGLEYALDRSLALTLSVKAGPSPYGGWAYGLDTCYDQFGRPYACGPGRYYYYTAPVAEALIGVSYRL